MARIPRRHPASPALRGAAGGHGAPDRSRHHVITIYKVFEKVLRERSENEALQVASQMKAGTVVDLDTSLALEAAGLRLPLADSLIYATALRWQATLWTQDDHFKDLPNVQYFQKE